MHKATGRYWRCYRQLPGKVRQSADKAFSLLRENPRHPSLHFKPIGLHDEYDRLVRDR
jgi:hypothetical protein